MSGLGTIVAEHPEMHEAMRIIQETLSGPSFVAMSRSNPDAMLYYRWYTRTPVGDKFACVVVKGLSSDPFVLTSYLTDRVKEGDIVWPKE